MDSVPIIDLNKVINGCSKECDKIKFSFHHYGIVIVKDKRVTQNDNNIFLDLMENYYNQTNDVKTKDSRPQYYYQVGSTPEFTEKPRNHCDKIKPGIDRPITLCPPEKDAKWRFFWRIGARPTTTKYKQLNAEQVIPENFKNIWEDCLNNWGNKLLESVNDISYGLALSLNLEPNTIKEMMVEGPHLLAPTGSDLDKFGKKNTVLAGYHYDLNFITCHGKSRYPGLFIWLRNGKRVAVKIPDGCLLMQAGKQLEWLTAGYIKAGFHEVIVSEQTIKKINENKNKTHWRVSSTFFAHLKSDLVLKPLDVFKNTYDKNKYPPIEVGLQVENELKNINLK